MFASAVFAPILVLASAISQLPGEDAYLAGYDALQDHRYADARAQFEAVAKVDGLLRDFARVRAWEAAWEAGDDTAEHDAWTWYHQSSPSAARDLCAARLGIRLAHSGRPEQASALLLPLAEIDPAPWWMDANLWDAGDALARAGGAGAQAGYALFLKIVERPGYVPQRNDAARRLKDSADPAHRRAAATALFRAGGFAEAEAILTATPFDLRGPANAALLLDQFDQTLATAALNVAEQPAVVQVLDANKANPWFSLLVARAVRKAVAAQNPDGGRGLALWHFNAQPTDREAGDSLWFVAQSLVARSPEIALDLYDQLADKAPRHARATVAANEIIQYWMKKNDLARAQSAAESLGKRFPESKYRAESYYDLAMRWRAAGNEPAAQRDLVFAINSGPGDYFAHRALAQIEAVMPPAAHARFSLKVDGVNDVLHTMPGMQAPLPPLPQAADQDPRILRARFFGLHGMEEAEWEALAVARGLGAAREDGPWYLALADAGVGFTAQQWADKHRWGFDGDTRTLARWRLEFPRPYWETYQQYGKALSVDPYFFAAVSRQESTFRASIVSRSGAVGVMQLMPATAKWMATKTPGVTLENATHLASPLNSLLLGSNYLAQMLDKFDNNKLFAAAAYNAGPGSVNKWLRGRATPTADEFVDLIPVEETRGYVRKVLGNLAAYRSIYPE